MPLVLILVEFGRVRTLIRESMNFWLKLTASDLTWKEFLNKLIQANQNSDNSECLQVFWRFALSLLPFSGLKVFFNKPL